MTDEPGVSRRGFMQVGVLSLSSVSSGGLTQLDPVGQGGSEYRPVAYLVGPRSARPSVGGGFFDNKTFGGYIYEALDGARWGITDPFDSWDAINNVNRVWVHSEADLPDVSGDVHPLETGRVYTPVGFVTHEYPLELGTISPIVGTHGGSSGFIYTGAGTGRGAAIQGTDANFFMRDCYLHAPGATLLDLTANQSTEMLVESYSTSDAAGLGNVADLGTIDGYRVPTFKGVNVEQFDAGLTFDGSPQKIAIFDSPFRSVTASGVDIFTIPSTASIEFVDMAGSFVKDVQSDTAVWRVDSSSLPSGVLQIRGTLHDSSVTRSNVVVDESGTDLRRDPAVNIANSFPLADTRVGGEIDLDSAGTVSGSGGGATVSLPTTAFALERMTSPSNGVLEYNARFDADQIIQVDGSVVASTTEYRVVLELNGALIGRSEITGETGGAGSPVPFSGATRLESLTDGDQLSVYLENTGGTSDLELDSLRVVV